MITAMKRTAIVALTAGAVSLAAVVFAQQAAFKRTVLQQADISAPGREAVTAFVEFQPGGSPGRHTHPGEEIGYVIEGTVVLEREGKPNATLRAGEAFLIPAGNGAQRDEQRNRHRQTRRDLHRREGQAAGYSRLRSPVMCELRRGWLRSEVEG